MPLTENGFDRQSFDDILSDLIDSAKLLFGDDIDTTETSVFGKILRLYATDAATNQELAEQVYLSAFPATASGVSLDRLAPLVGISRNPATYAQHEIQILGTPGTVVDMGFLVAAGDVVFHTLESYTISEGGSVSAIVECNEAGTIGNVPVSAINTIVNPVSGVTGILSMSIEKYATDIETDYSLRSRFQQAFSGIGSGTLEAVKGAILRVSGVESVYIGENDTNNTVGGLPPHSFICYVLAPQDTQQEIAEAIFSKKPVGVQTVGTVVTNVTDTGGGTHAIRFSWTQEVTVYVKATISTNSNYSADSLAQIQQNIVNKLAAYTNDQDVTATSLYSAIYVDGVDDVTSLTIGTDGETYSTNTIAIAYNQVARTAVGNIEVTVSGE